MKQLSASIERKGATLVLQIPTQCEEAVWHGIIRHLSLVGPSVQESDRQLIVHLNKAPQLRALLQSWPATCLSWRWSPLAERANEQRMEISGTLGRVVATPVEEQFCGDIDAELRSAGFIRELRDFQKSAVQRLLFMQNGADFSVPGSGKTTVAYGLYAILQARKEVDVLLVIAPPSAFESWELEARLCFEPIALPKMAKGFDGLRFPDLDVLVLNYERLENLRSLALIDGWVRGRRMMLILDEAHRVKGGERAIRGRRALTLAKRASHRFVLTGTPMPNDWRDLNAVMDLAWPGHGRRLSVGNLSGLRQRVYVRTTKSELELPPLIMKVERLDLHPAHRKLYNALRGDAAVLLEPGRAEAADLGKALLRLIASATNPAAILSPGRPLSIPAGASDPTLVDLLNAPMDHIVPMKVVRTVQIVRDNAAKGCKTLVWSSFVDNVRVLAEALREYQPAIITGSTVIDDPFSATDRTRELKRFREDSRCNVLVATPQTLGEGVSLHHVCYDQIHVDRSFAAGIFLQSLDRTHRLGMKQEVVPTCTVLLANDTIDEYVERVVERKISEMSDVLNDHDLRALSLPQDEHAEVIPSACGQMSEKELRELLGAVVASSQSRL